MQSYHKVCLLGEGGLVIDMDMLWLTVLLHDEVSPIKSECISQRITLIKMSNPIVAFCFLMLMTG